MSKLIERTAKGTIWHGAAQVALTVAGYVVAVIIARARNRSSGISDRLSSR